MGQQKHVLADFLKRGEGGVVADVDAIVVVDGGVNGAIVADDGAVVFIFYCCCGC